MKRMCLTDLIAHLDGRGLIVEDYDALRAAAADLGLALDLDAVTIPADNGGTIAANISKVS